MFGSLKLPLNKQKSIRPRAPLTDNNSRICRAASSDPILCNNQFTSSTNFKINNTPTSYQPASKTIPSAKNYISSIPLNNRCNSSVNSAASYHPNLFTTPNNNKENSFNSSMIFNHSFNSSSNSNSSFCDPNGSILHQTTQNQTVTQQLQEINVTNSSQIQQNQSTFTNSKLWDLRHDCTAHKQQSFTDVSTNTTSTNLSTRSVSAPQKTAPIQANYLSTATETSKGLYELVNNLQMCPIYQPPKPDTPPSEVSA